MPITSSFADTWRSSVAALTKRILTPQSMPTCETLGSQEWGQWGARRARYDFFWGYWSNSAYDSAHAWSGQFKTLFALYKFTRGCYNPMFRLGEFWATTIWGGALSAQKIGGRVVQSACPILTKNDALRDAIDQLWLDSRWTINKNITCRYGAVKGDVAIIIDDNPREGKVRLLPINPDTISWTQCDYNGNVLAYELIEPRYDPDWEADISTTTGPYLAPRMVEYKEKGWLDANGRTVHFQTFKNNILFGWDGGPAQWEKDYGFVPLVLIPHIQLHASYFWGASEYQTAFRKSMELDDVASKQHDQIRKASSPKWFLSGTSDPDARKPKVQGEEPSDTNTQPGRQELEFFYSPNPGSGAIPMVFPLDNQFVSIEIQNQLQAIEKDYPELRYDSARASGDASAKALREVRKGAEAKVQDRRAGYDAPFARAMRMALAIGAQGANGAGYPGYEGLPKDFSDPALDLAIGNRSVFLMDPLDRIEEEQALFTAWQTAKLAGWPDEILMQRFDWSPEEMASFLVARDFEQQRQLALQVALAQAQAAAKAAAAPAPAGPAA